MDISLDSVLFWSGLGLLLVGLFVFLTGKSTADGKKKNNNRFEAFGIKVDVNNPSLVLIILGGVMMLAPIMMQQERAETTQYSPPPLEPVSQTEQALAEAPPPPTIAAPPQQTAPQARQKTTDKISPPAEPKPAKLESNKPLVKQQPAPSRPIQTTTKPVKKIAAPPPASPSIASAQRAKSSAAKLPASTPPAIPVPAPAPKMMLVLVQADVSYEAGIRDETPNSYANKIAAELAARVEQQIDAPLRIKSMARDQLRSQLRGGKQAYRQLCRSHQSDLLLLGDLEVPFGWSDIESAYWPDLTLHLVNCDSTRNRKRKHAHLNPAHNDRFPFQVELSRYTNEFLADNRSMLEP